MSDSVKDRARLRALLRISIRTSVKPWFGPVVPVAIQRRMLDLLARTNLVPRGTRVEEVTLGGVECDRLEPAGTVGGPTLLYLHGGGYVIGSRRASRVLAAGLAHGAKATAYAADYRLAPEDPFPAALDDAVAVYRALLDGGHDPAALAIAGDSAGGGLTLATAIRLRTEGLPLPAALVLISPWTDLTMSGESISERAGSDPMLGAAGISRWAGLYLDGQAADDPLASPLFADLSGLPPMLIQVGSEEIVLSDSERLAERAGAAGTSVELERYEGLWHDFQMQAALLPSAADALARAGAFIARTTEPARAAATPA